MSCNKPKKETASRKSGHQGKKNQEEKKKKKERTKQNSNRSLSLNSIWPTETSSKLLAKCVIILGGEAEGKGRKGEGSG